MAHRPSLPPAKPLEENQSHDQRAAWDLVRGGECIPSLQKHKSNQGHDEEARHQSAINAVGAMRLVYRVRSQASPFPQVDRGGSGWEGDKGDRWKG